MSKRDKVLLGVWWVLAVGAVFALPLSWGTFPLGADASAASPSNNTPIHLSGNEQGQGVLVFINPWGQVVVQLRDAKGHVALEEYTPLQVDSYTTSVLVDVCGDNVYLVESGEGLVYYHLALPTVKFDCCEDDFTLWLPGVGR